MLKTACLSLLSSFLIIILFCGLASAEFIDYGYYEIVFEGTTTDFEGNVEFPAENTLLTYTPTIGDSISIHFGGHFWRNDDPNDAYGHGYSSWSNAEGSDLHINFFQISATNETTNYVIELDLPSDTYGGSASVEDYFYFDFYWDDGGFGYIDYDYNDGCGIFYLMGGGFLDFTWSAELSDLNFIVKPVPEPGTILLLGVGLLGITKFKKRKGRYNQE